MENSAELKHLGMNIFEEAKHSGSEGGKLYARFAVRGA
jgi:hypothetical protein